MQQSEWRKGWPVVLGAVGGMMTVAAPSALTGLVMAPLQTEFSWSRAEISASILVTSICALIFAPVAGRIIARFGARQVALWGFLSTSLGFVAIGLSGPGLWSWFAAWFVYGTLSVLLGPIVWSSAVSSLFDRQRGLALSIALSGSGFAFAVWPPLLGPVLAAYDWRLVYFLLAAVCVAILLPVNVLALRGLPGPSAGAGSTSGSAEPEAALHAPVWGPTLGQALAGSLLWRLLAAFILCAAVNGSLMIHFYPILTELRFPAQEATYLTAAMGPAMIAGRIATGWLMDRFHAPYVVAAALVMPAATLLILMAGPGAGAALVASLVLGLSTGAITCAAAYLVGRYFGLRDFAAIFGVLIGIFGVSFGMIPTLAGHYFDVAGSYKPLFLIMLLATLPVGLLVATLGRYPEPATARN